jgi:hypothetical protein
MAKNKLVSFFEGFIMLMIGLVLIQTFLEDLSIVTNWPVFARKVLVITAFAFDLIFTIEFLVRFFLSLMRKNAGEYFFRNRGWVDLLSSVPLLLLNSGPGLYALLTGTVFAGAISIVSLLKVVKAIRIARMLRMLRFLKVFRQIKFADSVMAQRHMTRIVTTMVSFFILMLIAGNLAFSFLPTGDIEDRQNMIMSSVAGYVASEPDALKDKGDLAAFCGQQTLLLKLNHDGKTVYSRHDSDFYDRNYANTDYNRISQGEWEFFFDWKPLHKRQSRESIIYFIVIVGLIVGLMLSYSPHFANAISDPVNIMVRGMGEKSYNLEVKIPPRLENDDMFILAKKYNEEFLPMKARTHAEGHEGAALDITMDDIQDLFK